MTQYEKSIQKIGEFLHLFTDIDFHFFNAKGEKLKEYSHHEPPAIFKPHVIEIQNHIIGDTVTCEKEILLHSNDFMLNFLSTTIRDNQGELVGTIIAGPFLSTAPTIDLIQDIILQSQLTISAKHSLTEYYSSLPLMNEYKIKVIAEFLSFHMANIDQLEYFQANIGQAFHTFQQQKSELPVRIQEEAESSVDVVKERYAWQKELMLAVEQGDIATAEKLMKIDLASMETLPDRFPNDPLRSQKNLAITFNTCLRIATERGGLSPIVIHSISEKFAVQIEKTSSLKQLRELESVMLREYCEAVRKFSLKHYSFAIRKAVEYIHLNIEQELSLDTISEAIQVSKYELSRNFKKKTGRSITDYINNQRIKEASNLLENHNLNITDIAYMVGFNDVNYFTKMFKKMRGMTPSEYRRGLRGGK